MNEIKKNYIYNIVYQSLILVLPLITVPYISRILGSEGVGIYSYTYSIAYYFVMVGMLGINNYGNRIIAKVKDDKEKLNKTFSSLAIFHIMSSAILTAMYGIYVLLFANTNKTVAMLQIFYVISGMWDTNWFFFGMEKFKLTLTRNIIIRLLTVACIFIFVKNKGDLPIYTLIMSVGFLLNKVSILSFLGKYVKFVKCSFKEVMEHFKPCIVLFIPVIAVNLYKIMDKIMLGNYSTMSEVRII